MPTKVKSEHTPSTFDVEMRYIRFRQLEADIGGDGVTPHQPGEFKRWYEAEIRKAKAAAWEEVKSQMFDVDVYIVKTETRRVRADSEHAAIKSWDDGEVVAETYHDIQVGEALETP